MNTAPKGFRLKAKPSKADDANVLARLQDLFNRSGAEEHGTATDPATGKESPISRKVLVLVAISDDGQYPDIRKIIKAQHRLLTLGLDVSNNRLDSEPDATVITGQ